MNLEFSSFGKWILAGEHTVLRGGHALAFPVPSKKMDLYFTTNTHPLTISVSGEQSDILESFFRQLLIHGLSLLNKSISELTGAIKIHNSIPIGTGLGGSAVLSVNLAKFFCSLNWITEDQLFSFARKLEDLAHGKSSGVDIATVLAKQGIYFSRTLNEDKPWSYFSPNWHPPLFLYYSGQRGLTSQCIAQVEHLLMHHSELGSIIDKDMKQSLSLCKRGLENQDDFTNLKEGIELAESCFERWGLITEELKHQIHWLKKHGAIAVKPVGSGGGGYLLGLWPNKQLSLDLKEQLIPCFS